jgi:hypothetical protein
MILQCLQYYGYIEIDYKKINQDFKLVSNEDFCDSAIDK